MLRSRSGRPGIRASLVSLTLITAGVCIALAAEKAARPASSAAPSTKASASPKKGELNLTNLPVPIGHEIKGLVLPEFNVQGQLLGRVEAGSAVRTDQTHVVFKGIKLTTFTETNQPDLDIEMSDSTLDLQTRVVSSPHRTVVKRSDFNIVGDSFTFDTVAKLGTLKGNVKMVITGQDFRPPEEKEGSNE